MLGAIVASAVIVAMQLPFVHEPPVIHLSLSSYDSFDYTPPPLAWPSQGSAAIDVPALGITRVWHNRVVPIASLTKLMTVYVALKRFPLSIGQTGPCLTVSDDAGHQLRGGQVRRRLRGHRRRGRTTL